MVRVLAKHRAAALLCGRARPPASTRSRESSGVESEPALVFVNDSATRPRVESVQGVVRAVVEDRFEQRASHTYYSISSKGDSIPIAFPTAAVRAAVRTGKPVTLEGFRDSGRFYPRVTEIAEPEATTAPLAAFGVRRVAVILVNYLNDSDQPITLAQATSMLATVNQFYQEASYQQFSLTADVYGYLSLPINETCNDNGDTASRWWRLRDDSERRHAGGAKCRHQSIVISDPRVYWSNGNTVRWRGGYHRRRSGDFPFNASARLTRGITVSSPMSLGITLGFITPTHMRVPRQFITRASTAAFLNTATILTRWVR